ncbi:MAG: hypothetical protein IKP96_00540 [Elusimicrobiaceae bacterium]|nr:hypothetical protein [Elusimicrobiaceae bacterium]
MRIGKIEILPWNRKNFLPRIIVVGLFFVWVLGCTFAIINEHRIIRVQQQEIQEQEQRREEILRREAEYKRRVRQDQMIRSSVQNAVDYAR